MRTRQEAINEQARLFPPLPPDARGNLAPTLPEICLTVRAVLNGSFDSCRWDDKCLREVYEMLQLRLNTWDHTKLGDHLEHSFDIAVLTMVRITTLMLGRYFVAKEKEQKPKKHAKQPGVPKRS